jgi:hypothetical protein
MTSCTRKSGACGGIVTLIQRFGSSLNLNVHLHMLVLDGVYANEHGKLRFQPLPAPAPALMTQLLDVIVLRVLRCLERDGLLIRDPEQPWLDLEARDALDALGAASIQYRAACRSGACSSSPTRSTRHRDGMPRCCRSGRRGGPSTAPVRYRARMRHPNGSSPSSVPQACDCSRGGGASADELRNDLLELRGARKRLAHRVEPLSSRIIGER